MTGYEVITLYILLLLHRGVNDTNYKFFRLDSATEVQFTEFFTLNALSLTLTVYRNKAVGNI